MITFDTNILLSATLWDGSVAQKLLFELIKKDITIYSSKPIIDEYQKILKRDFKFTEEEVSERVQKVLAFVVLVEPKVTVEVIKSDPTDNRIIECALASHSKYIISYDKKHLLKLGKYKTIEIITPEMARRIV